MVKEAHTNDALTRLTKLPSSDAKSRASTYAELAELHPENPEYAAQTAKWSAEWKRQQWVVAEKEKMVEKEKAAAAAEQAKVTARKNRIQAQFSGWDGSYRPLEKIIKASMNDPDSYKHVETKYSDLGEYLIVETTFRGKNAFGGVVKNSVRAKFTLDGELVEIVSQGK